jgi:hypothetical protein
MARLTTSGTVKACKMTQWMIRSQAPNDYLSMEKVQRLSGGRPLSKGSKIESNAAERPASRPRASTAVSLKSDLPLADRAISGWCMAVLRWWVALSG